MPRYPHCNKQVLIILSKRGKTQPDICHAVPFSYLINLLTQFCEYNEEGIYLLKHQWIAPTQGRAYYG